MSHCSQPIYIDHPFNESLMIRLDEFVPFEEAYTCGSIDSSSPAEGGEAYYEIVDSSKNPIEWDYSIVEENIIGTAIVEYMQNNNESLFNMFKIV